MRLSDAIALGRTLKKPVRGMMGIGTNHGCALGMADAGVGGAKFGNEFATELCTWPWLSGNTRLPCGCRSRRGFSSNHAGIIAHLFDEHVFEKEDWTLDQLIDWVRSVEPAEENCEARETETAERKTSVEGEAALKA
jgi:hypothetical protein